MSMEHATIPILIESGSAQDIRLYVKRMFPSSRILETNTEGSLTVEKLRTITRLATIQQAGSVLCIVWAFDTASVQVQNMFLKTLEEQPYRLIFCLVCHNAQRVLPTIESRCQTIRLTKPTASTESIDIAAKIRTWTREKTKQSRDDGLIFIDKLLQQGALLLIDDPTIAHLLKNILYARRTIDAFNIDPIVALENTLIT